MANFIVRKQAGVIASAVTGTSMMTLYSYLISGIRKKNFKEPVLLAKMSRLFQPWAGLKKSFVTGWMMHYLVGLLFAEAYAPFWSQAKERSNVKTGLVLGGVSGLAAILLWKFSLNAHPFAPAVDFMPFAGQLFIAHLIFGVFAAIGYSLTTGCKNSNERFTGTC